MRHEVIGDVNLRSGPGTDFEDLGDLLKGQIVEVPSTMGWLPVLMVDEDQSDESSPSVGWASARFLRVAKETPYTEAPPVINPASKDDPALAWLMSKKGLKEVPGAGDNPEIVGWFKLLDGFPKSDWHDSTAWCSVCMNAAEVLTGASHGTSSAAAVSWLKWGVAVKEPQRGDKVIFDWKDGGHHVGIFLRFLTDVDKNDRVEVIGGNQGNAISITDYPAGAVMGYRRRA